MTALTTSWSVKGISPTGRETAKAAARTSGISLGNWLERAIMLEAGATMAAAPPRPPADVPADLDEDAFETAVEENAEAEDGAHGLVQAADGEALTAADDSGPQTMATAEAASETPGTPAGPAASFVDNAAADGPVSTTETTVAALAIRLIAGQTQLRRAIGPLRDSVKGLAERVETLEDTRAQTTARSASPMLGPLPEHEAPASIDGTVVPDPFVAYPRRAARRIERATSSPVRRSRRWLSGAATATFLLAVAGSAAWLTGARPPVQFSWTPQPEPAALQTPASPSVILPIEVRRPPAPPTPDDVAALPAPPVAPAPRNLDPADAAVDAALSITPAAGPVDPQAPPQSRLFAAARTDPNNGNGATEPRPQPTNATSLAVGTHPAPRPAAPPAAEPAPAVEPAAAAVDVIRPAAGPAADPSGQQALTQPPAAPGPAETTAPPAADGSLLARLRHLADSGDHSAQYDLAVFHLQGSEVEQDYAAAALWLERAAKGGLAQAQYNLGVMLDQGLGAPSDPVRAVGWFGLAADQGHARAQYALAIAYAEGRGAGRDLPLATEWLQLAADQGLADAQYALGVIREEGLAAAPDLAEAYYWYQAAAENGIADATQRVAEIEPQLTAAQWRALATGAYGQPGGALFTLASIDIDVTLVREIQQLLQVAGFNPGPADGKLGSRTRAAIRAYQAAAGLAIDGLPTEEVAQHLRETAEILPAGR